MPKRKNRNFMYESKLSLSKYLLTEETEDEDEEQDEEEVEEKDPEDAPEEDADLEDNEADEEDGVATEEEEDEEEDDEEVETSAEDKIRLQDTLDNELEAVFGDFEVRARKSAALQNESKKYSLAYRLLKEEAEQEFDVNQFAADTARLIKNYQNLLDMEAIIFNRAKQYILDKYGDTMLDQFRDILIQRHGVDFIKDESTLEAPVAVGAVDSGGGGGGI